MDFKCCIDCEFFHAESPFPRCLHKESAKTDYTDGSINYTSTSIMRNYNHLCGPDAKYFIRKEGAQEDHELGIPWLWIFLALLTWFVVYCIIW